MPEIVKVLRAQHAGQRLVASEQESSKRSRRRAPSARPVMSNTPLHGRVPVRLERHQPVERRERDRQPVDDQAAGADELQPAVQARPRGTGPALPTSGSGKKSEQQPGARVDDPRPRKNGRVQVCGLVMKHRIARDVLRARPGMQDFSSRRKAARRKRASSSRVRVAASSGRRMGTPHAPPVT